MYHLIISGHLTEDATYKKLDGDRSPINFSVAINFSAEKVIYKKFTYWIPSADNPPVMEKLKKGHKVTVHSNREESSEYTDTDGNPKTSVNYLVNDLSI